MQTRDLVLSRARVCESTIPRVLLQADCERHPKVQSRWLFFEAWTTPRRFLAETLILKVSPDEPSEDQELKFELDFLAGLTVQARFELMFERSRQIAEALEATWTSSACFDP